jgi:hypothetical protein
VRPARIGTTGSEARGSVGRLHHTHRWPQCRAFSVATRHKRDNPIRKWTLERHTIGHTHVRFKQSKSVKLNASSSANKRSGTEDRASTRPTLGLGVGLGVGNRGPCVHQANPDSCAFNPANTVFLKLFHDAVKSPFQFEAPNFCDPVQPDL